MKLRVLICVSPRGLLTLSKNGNKLEAAGNDAFSQPSNRSARSTGYDADFNSNKKTHKLQQSLLIITYYTMLL